MSSSSCVRIARSRAHGSPIQRIPLDLPHPRARTSRNRSRVSPSPTAPSSLSSAISNRERAAPAHPLKNHKHQLHGAPYFSSSRKLKDARCVFLDSYGFTPLKSSTGGPVIAVPKKKWDRRPQDKSPADVVQVFARFLCTPLSSPGSPFRSFDWDSPQASTAVQTAKGYGDSPFALKSIEESNVWNNESADWPMGITVFPCALPLNAGFPSNFVADPFFFIEDDVFYLFFEIKNFITMQGDIGVAMSEDKGATWIHLGTALDERWHFSYPMFSNTRIR